jgi:AcrR family transcriptional regulator
MRQARPTHVPKGQVRTYHHGALAEAMVEQALLEVRLRGADHVSLRGVAQALDVSPSAAYNHFADKDALLSAVGTCGLAALDERMTRALAAHPGDTPETAWARLSGLGRAYLAFAAEDPHLFRLTFSPLCAAKNDAENSGPYLKLNHALDDLHARHLLRDGIRDGLDVVVWSATHGTACLIVEGMLPPSSIDDFLTNMIRMISAASG